MANRKQGVQGSYNDVTVNIIKDDKRFRRQWVQSLLRELNYNPTERQRWEQVAQRHLSAQ